MKQIKNLIKYQTLIQFLKFAFVGVINTAVDFAVLNLLMWTTGIYKGRWIILLNAIAFSVAVINSYIWNKFWTFKAKETEAGPQEFTKFLIISLVGIGLNTGIVYFVTTYVPPILSISAPLWANTAKILATVLSLIWNFIGYKFLVFKR